jgi:hypothetical protein
MMMKIAAFMLLAALTAMPAAAQNRKVYEAEKKEAQKQQRADYWDARYTQYAIDQGYRDGFDQGKMDYLRSTRKDVTKDGRYRSGMRGYQKRYGAEGPYQNYYREGFRRGYEQAFIAGQQGGKSGNRAQQKQKR